MEKLYTTKVSQVNEHSSQTSLPAGDYEPRAAETAEVAQQRSMFPEGAMSSAPAVSSSSVLPTALNYGPPHGICSRVYTAVVDRTLTC